MVESPLHLPNKLFIFGANLWPFQMQWGLFLSFGAHELWVVFDPNYRQFAFCLCGITPVAARIKLKPHLSGLPKANALPEHTTAHP